MNGRLLGQSIGMVVDTYHWTDDCPDKQFRFSPMQAEGIIAVLSSVVLAVYRKACHRLVT